ncbi:response regulator [Limimaricola sp. AA108-03]|uniref:response regulator n=1 Tax=Limimaricola sp. AA108-03 TaxID=3425945 RepID=UPI003D77A8A1
MSNTANEIGSQAELADQADQPQHVLSAKIGRLMALIMIVEDEILIAIDLHEHLEELGHDIHGPYSSVAQATRALGTVPPDLAVLDVSLGDAEIDPLAATLQSMGVPVVFHSGHPDKVGYEQRFPGSIFCPKPSSPQEIRNAILKQISLSL